MAQSEETLNCLLMKEESEKIDLKLNIQKNWLKTQHSEN